MKRLIENLLRAPIGSFGMTAGALCVPEKILIPAIHTKTEKKAC